MYRKNGHHDRGPPEPDQLTVDANELMIGIALVVAGPGLVEVSDDAVVIGPDEVVIVE